MFMQQNIWLSPSFVLSIKSPSPSKVHSLNIHPSKLSVTHRLICDHLQPMKSKLLSRSWLTSQTQTLCRGPASSRVIIVSLKHAPVHCELRLLQYWLVLKKKNTKSMLYYGILKARSVFVFFLPHFPYLPHIFPMLS